MGTQTSQALDAPDAQNEQFIDPSFIHTQGLRLTEQSDYLSNIYESEYIPSSSYYDVHSHLTDISLTCPLCYEQIPPDFKVALPCHSPFCSPCIRKYLETKINDLEVLKITCPMIDCPYEFTKEAIKAFVSDLAYVKFLKVKEDEELSKNPYLRWCPVPDCQGHDIASFDKIELICNVCSGHYCFYCGGSWRNMHKCKLSDKSIEYWFKRGVRYCPNCKRKVVKDLGCDHMTCVKCKYEWCWLCGEKYNYDHFSECEIIKYRKTNPSWKMILGLIFLPMFFPFLPVIAGFLKISEFSQRENSKTMRFFSFLLYLLIIWPLAFIALMIVCPFFVLFYPLVVSIVCIYDLFQRYSYYTCYSILVFFGGVALYPLSFSAVLIGVFGVHLGGWGMLIKKIKISMIRCYNSEYLLPKSAYAKNTLF